MKHKLEVYYDECHGYMFEYRECLKCCWSERDGKKLPKKCKP